MNNNKTIYLYYASNFTYEWIHASLWTGVGLGLGLIENEIKNIIILWDGEETKLHGILHQNIHSVVITNNDIVFVLHPGTAKSVDDNNEIKQNIGHANEKWLYVPADLDAIPEYWKFYNRIFIENEKRLIPTKKACPWAVVYVLPKGTIKYGVELLNKTTPYPIHANKKFRNLFFSGRMVHEHIEETQSIQIIKLMEQLPEEYHMWICSTAIWIPLDKFMNIENLNKKLIINIPIQWTWTLLHDTDIFNNISIDEYILTTKDGNIFIEPSAAILAINKELFNNNKRIHFLGTKPFDEIWHWHHYAWTSIDFGYSYYPKGVNSKILEAMRAGGRVVADGLSDSFPLIEQYNAGKVVPYRNAKEMAKTIIELPEENRFQKLERAELFAKQESWEARSKLLIPIIKECENINER